MYAASNQEISIWQIADFGIQTKDDKDISMRKYIVPVHSFNEHIFREYLYHVKEGIIVSTAF